MDTGYFFIQTRSQTQLTVETMVEAIDCLLIVAGDVGSSYRTLDPARRPAVVPLAELVPIAAATSVKLGARPIH